MKTIATVLLCAGVLATSAIVAAQPSRADTIVEVNGNVVNPDSYRVYCQDPWYRQTYAYYCDRYFGNVGPSHGDSYYGGDAYYGDYPYYGGDYAYGYPYGAFLPALALGYYGYNNWGHNHWGYNNRYYRSGRGNWGHRNWYGGNRGYRGRGNWAGGNRGYRGRGNWGGGRGVGMRGGGVRGGRGGRR